MNEIVTLLSGLILLLGYFFLMKKYGDKEIDLHKFGKKLGDKFGILSVNVLTKRFLTVLLLAFYACRLFSYDLLIDQIGLGGTSLSETGMVFYILFRWITLLCVGVAMTDGFFEKRNSKDFLAFIVFPVTIANICIFRINVDVLFGKSLYSSEAILYSMELIVELMLSGKQLLDIIVNKNYEDIKKRIGKMLLFGLFYLMAFMPIYLPQTLFGETGGKTADFELSHRIVIYITVGFTFFAYAIFRNKSKEDIRYMLITLSLSGFISYFTIQADRSSITSYPLHLCNTALILMIFAYWFRINSIFYFTYLVNVLGSVCAILMPNTGDNQLFTDGTILFWYNHIYAFVLPILGVMLKEFPRPNLKLFGKSVVAFSIYVFVAAWLNAWLNNSPSLNPLGPEHDEVDYFFLYSDFFVDKFSWAGTIKYNFIATVHIGDTDLKFYYMYIIVIFLIFIALMFAMWAFYAAMYKIEDSHIELARRKKLAKVDKLEMLKEMKGRSISEPLHPENADKVIISHFSKVYNGCTKKAVDDLNLEVHAGELFGFIGHNGAGKSTTIKSLVGIQTITDGTIEICGYDIARQPMKAKEQMGYVSDNHAVYEKLTGREYVYYVAELYNVNKEERDARYEKYTELFELSHAMDDEIKSYSHGMKQKLVLIAALVHNPKVWILDEPLTGLDPTSIYQVKQCMREHADAGNIVFFSSHVIDVVEKICDRVAIISGGKLCKVCTSEELRSENVSLEQLYLQFSAHDGHKEVDILEDKKSDINKDEINEKEETNEAKEENSVENEDKEEQTSTISFENETTESNN